MKHALPRLFAYWILGCILFAFEDAHAAKMYVHWVAPTTNTDGSPLTDLAGFRVEWGSCNPDGSFGQFQAGASVGPTVTRTAIYPTGLTLVCARVYAFNSKNVLSASSNVDSGSPLPKLSQPAH